MVPVLCLDVSFDERYNGRHYRVLDSACEECKAGSGSHRDIPLVLICVFFLLGEQEKQDGSNFRKSDFGKMLGFRFGTFTVICGLRRLSVCIGKPDWVRYLLSFNRQVNFFLTYCGPELHSLECNSLIGVFHAHNGQLKYQLKSRSRV